jgi:arylsulfatase A-like enzyme
MGLLPALIVLTVAFLAAEAYTLFIAGEGLVPRSKIFSSLSVSDFPAALLMDLIQFAGVVLALHGLVVIYALAVRRFLVRRLQWRRDRADGIAFLVFLGVWAAVIMWNGILFPRSHLVYSLGSDALDLAVALALVSLAALPLLLIVGDVLLRYVPGFRLRAAAVAVTAALAAVPLILPSQDATAVSEPSRAPNVIIIGVDSLRPEYVLDAQRSSLMPNLAGLVSDAAWFDEAVTPLARTYPSWMSILSGRYPVRSGARINLSDPQWVDRSGLFSRSLQRQGYRTVLAIDERRFSNMDERYGFDEVIGPAAGAADFVMELAGDLPMVNLLSGTPVAKYLLPFVYVNRAVSRAYVPNVFDRELAESLSDNGSGRPLFLAAHFCLPHWPYHWAAESDYDGRVARSDEDLAALRRGLYEEALRVADGQVGRLFASLQRNGYLDNALVVLLSDHGESFGPQDLPVPVGGDDLPALRYGYGHGTSVFIPSQNRILLAFRGMGDLAFSPGRRRQPAATLDIAPTIRDLLGLEQGARSDGVSLVPWLADALMPARERRFFLETGFFLPALATANFNLEKIVEQGSGFYSIDADGRLIINHEFRQQIVDGKQLGVTDGRITIGVMPVDEAGRLWFVSDLAAGTVAPLTTGAAKACDGACMDLLDSLAEFYAEDLSQSDLAFIDAVRAHSGVASSPVPDGKAPRPPGPLTPTALAAENRGSTDG